MLQLSSVYHAYTDYTLMPPRGRLIGPSLTYPVAVLPVFGYLKQGSRCFKQSRAELGSRKTRVSDQIARSIR